MKKVLIIDDESIIQTLCDNLELHGFDAILLQDYRNMNNELKKGYDAIILDIMMPILPSYFSEEELVKVANGMQTGVLLFDIIRKEYPKIPIVFYSTNGNRIACDEHAVIIRKPELVRSIAKTLNDLIEKASS